MTGPYRNHVEARSSREPARQYVSETHDHKPDAPSRTESRSAAKHTAGTAGARTEEKGPFMDAAYMLPESERYCTCCERELSGGAFRYLELDQRSDTYHDLNDVPADRSQGWFPFGLTCARKLVAKEVKRRAALAKAGGAA